MIPQLACSVFDVVFQRLEVNEVSQRQARLFLRQEVYSAQSKVALHVLSDSRQVMDAWNLEATRTAFLGI